MDLKAFWLAWKRDILRFAVVCVVALLLGVVVNKVVARTHSAVEHGLPRQIEGIVGAMDADFLSGSRHTAETWTHREHLGRGQSVWIRNMNGGISVTPATGDSLEVAAVKTYHADNPAGVKIVRVAVPNGVVLCAVWEGSGAHCGSGAEYNQKNLRHDDVAVDFTVRLPRGALLDANTVNGSIHVTGATAPVTAATVNGHVELEGGFAGPVNATTIDGNIRVTLRAAERADTGAVVLRTINGSLTLELPARVDASVEARTLNGAIESDYPLEESGRFVGHHSKGTIGTGGRRIELNAVNGSIRLAKASEVRAVPPSPPSPPAPPAPPAPPGAAESIPHS
jgi:hypothetical protein